MRMLRASDSVRSRRSGTTVRSADFAIVRLMFSPAASVSPAGGSWLTTVPTVALAWTNATCRTSSPTSRGLGLRLLEGQADEARDLDLGRRGLARTADEADSGGMPPARGCAMARSAVIHSHGLVARCSTSSSSPSSRAARWAGARVASRVRVGPRDAGDRWRSRGSQGACRRRRRPAPAPAPAPAGAGRAWAATGGSDACRGSACRCRRPRRRRCPPRPRRDPRRSPGRGPRPSRPADPKRSSAFVASAFRVIASSAGGIPLCSADGLGTAPVSRAVAIAAAVSPVHGRRPVRSSNRTIPRL